MTVLSYGLSLTNAAFLGPLRLAHGAVKGFTSSLSNVGNIVTGLASLPGAVNTLLAPLSQPITLSGDMETLDTSFKALLKNGPAAKAMVKDLIEFADVTPFDPVPVAATGKQLLAFGFAAKQVKPLLRDIGDLAAAMEQPIEEVGSAFGRLKAGQFGEAFERLRAFGITKNDLENEGLKFDKSGSFKGSADDAIEAVRKTIRQKFGGGMDDLSTTFKGLFSTFSGYWDALQRSFGTPIMQALKPVLEDGTNLLKQWAPIAQDFGQKIAGAIEAIRNLFKNGSFFDTAKTGLLGIAKLLIQNMGVGISTAISLLATGLKAAFQSAIGLLSDSNFWEGIRGSVQSITDSIRSSMLGLIANIISMLPAPMRIGANAEGLRKGAADAKGDSKLAMISAKEQFAMVDMNAAMAPMVTAANEGGQLLKDGFAQVVENIKSSPELAQIGQNIAQAASNSNAPAMLPLAEQMRRASTNDTFLSGTTNRSTRQTTDGVEQVLGRLLNPQAIERFISGTGAPKTTSESKQADKLLNPVKEILRQLSQLTDKVSTQPAGVFTT